MTAVSLLCRSCWGERCSAGLVLLPSSPSRTTDPVARGLCKPRNGVSSSTRSSSVSLSELLLSELLLLTGLRRRRDASAEFLSCTGRMLRLCFGSAVNSPPAPQCAEGWPEGLAAPGRDCSEPSCGDYGLTDWEPDLSRRIGGVRNSRGRSSSPEGLAAMEGTEVARLDRGADISEGGEEGVTGERSPTGDRRLGVSHGRNIPCGRNTGSRYCIYWKCDRFTDYTLQKVNVISPSSTCSWINILVDPGTTFQSTIRTER